MKAGPFPFLATADKGFRCRWTAARRKPVGDFPYLSVTGMPISGQRMNTANPTTAMRMMLAGIP